MPSNFIIFARPNEMANIFKNVKIIISIFYMITNQYFSQAIELKVIERFNRWRLFYSDFVETNIVKDLISQYPELISFIPSSDMCCIYLKQSLTKSCACNEKETVSILLQ